MRNLLFLSLHSPSSLGILHLQLIFLLELDSKIASNLYHQKQHWWAFKKCSFVKLWECLCVDIQKYDCLIIKYGDIYLNQVLFKWSLPQSLLSWKDRPISSIMAGQCPAFSLFIFFGQFNKCKMVSHWLICISLVLAEFGHLFSYAC